MWGPSPSLLLESEPQVVSLAVNSGFLSLFSRVKDAQAVVLINFLSTVVNN
jgi:hypothetical protein